MAWPSGVLYTIPNSSLSAVGEAVSIVLTSRMVLLQRLHDPKEGGCSESSGASLALLPSAPRPPGSSCLSQYFPVVSLAGLCNVRVFGVVNLAGPGFQSCRMICMAVLLFTPFRWLSTMRTTVWMQTRATGLWHSPSNH